MQLGNIQIYWSYQHSALPCRLFPCFWSHAVINRAVRADRSFTMTVLAWEAHRSVHSWGRAHPPRRQGEPPLWDNTTPIKRTCLPAKLCKWQHAVAVPARTGMLTNSEDHLDSRSWWRYGAGMMVWELDRSGKNCAKVRNESPGELWGRSNLAVKTV